MIKSLLIIILSGLLSASVFAQDTKPYPGNFRFAEGREIVSVSIKHLTPTWTTCNVSVNSKSGKYLAVYEVNSTEETDDFIKSGTLFKYMRPLLFSVQTFVQLLYDKKAGTLKVYGLPHNPDKIYELKKEN